MIQWFDDIFNKFGSWLLSVLPGSPFAGFLNNFNNVFKPYLGILNYFIPIGDFLIIFSVWLSAIALFYVYSIILRWVKMI